MARTHKKIRIPAALQNRMTQTLEGLSKSRISRGISKSRHKLRSHHPLAALHAKGAILGRAFIALGAFLVCACPPLFVNDIIAYIPLLTLVFVVILSFIYLQVLSRALSFSEDSLLPSCERGSEIEFVIKFENASPLVFLRIEPYIYISDLFGAAAQVTPTSMTMMPFEKRDFRFEASFDHIGTYAAGVQKIVISDLLGLFIHTIVNKESHQVEVLPRLFDLTRADFSSESSEESMKAFQAVASDDMDYAGVREYVWGDPIKLIHWKLSARAQAGQYFTRLYETFNEPGLSIIIDTSSPAYSTDALMCIYDSVVESALSINNYALDRGLDSVLMFKDKNDENTSLRLLNLAEFSSLSSSLPRIKIGDDTQAVELLRSQGNQIHGRNNIAFCTAHVSQAGLSTLIELKNRKRNPVFFLAVSSDMPKEELREYTRPLRRLDAAQIPYYVISSAQDLQEDEA